MLLVAALLLGVVGASRVARAADLSIESPLFEPTVPESVYRSGVEYRKRAECHEDPVTQIMQTHQFHKTATTCDVTAGNPVVIVEEAFDHCLTLNGDTYIKYRYKPGTTDVIQKCSWSFAKQEDICCATGFDDAGRCVELNIPANDGLCHAVLGTLGGFANDTMLSLKATVKVVPSYELKAPVGTPRHEFHRMQYDGADCMGSVKDEKITGCHMASTSTSDNAGAYAHFENQFSGDRARFCFYYHSTCADQNQPAYLCRVFTDVGQCENDGNNLSHKIVIKPVGTSSSGAARRAALAIGAVVVAVAAAALF